MNTLKKINKVDAIKSIDLASIERMLNYVRNGRIVDTVENQAAITITVMDDGDDCEVRFGAHFVDPSVIMIAKAIIDSVSTDVDTE